MNLDETRIIINDSRLIFFNMENNGKKVFNDNPFSGFKVATPLLAGIFILTIIFVSLFGIPKEFVDKKYSKESFVFFIFCIEIGTLLICAIAFSISKKRTIVCTKEGCHISGKNFWGFWEENVHFLWNEVTDFAIVRGDKGRTDLQVTANGKNIFMFTRFSHNRHEFDNVFETVNHQTGHLSFEWVKSKEVGTRQIIEEKQKYYKVARIQPKM